MVSQYLIVCGAFAAIAGAQSPSNLQVVSATKDAVSLSWSAPNLTLPVFSVERKALGSDAWQGIGVTTIALTSATDKNIDPYSTYLYRVRIVTAGAVSDPSNEVTVGPPPQGFSRILDTPDSSPDPRQFGQHLQMVLDGNGDPMFTYYEWQPNGVFEDGSLYFQAWDRANYRWKQPVKIQKTGDQSHRDPFSLARDGVKGTLAIAYEASTPALSVLRLATSRDNGATWNLQTVKTDDYTTLAAPVVQLNNDRITYAYLADVVNSLSGKVTDAPDLWTAQTTSEGGTMLQIAGDGEGNPALVYWTATTDGYNRFLRFWRPGQSPVTAMDSNGIQNDDPDARLAFQGILPRIVAEVLRDSRGYGVNDFYLYYTGAGDKTGGSWNSPVDILPDGNASLALTSFAVTPSGQATVGLAVNGGNTGGVVCGALKLARTSDLTSWSTCSPADPSLNLGASWAQVAYAGNNRAYVLYTEVASGDKPNGIYIWRE